jgi:acyl-CoA reductase-like NAD-dependent aldehyde dehydrogenase
LACFSPILKPLFSLSLSHEQLTVAPGQLACISAERVYVADVVHDMFVDEVVKQVRALSCASCAGADRAGCAIVEQAAQSIRRVIRQLARA